MSLVHASVTAASLYRAKLFASEPSPLGSDWALVMQSGEMEILIDALEDLWEMVMHRAGSLAGEYYWCTVTIKFSKISCANERADE